MRPVATSVGPLVHQIRGGLHLSGADAGLLLTIPVLCFGARRAGGAARSAARLGIARTITLVLVAITAGLLVLRSTGGVALLFAGTTLAAAGAACGNVLLPVIVRRSFADRVGQDRAPSTRRRSLRVAALSAGVDGADRERARRGLARRSRHLGGAGTARAARLAAAARARPRPPAGGAERPRHAKLRDVTREPARLAASRSSSRCSRGASTRRRVAAEHLREPRAVAAPTPASCSGSAA